MSMSMLVEGKVSKVWAMGKVKDCKVLLVRIQGLTHPNSWSRELIIIILNSLVRSPRLDIHIKMGWETRCCMQNITGERIFTGYVFVESRVSKLGPGSQLIVGKGFRYSLT